MPRTPFSSGLCVSGPGISAKCLILFLSAAHSVLGALVTGASHFCSAGGTPGSPGLGSSSILLGWGACCNILTVTFGHFALGVESSCWLLKLGIGSKVPSQTRLWPLERVWEKVGYCVASAYWCFASHCGDCPSGPTGRSQCLKGHLAPLVHFPNEWYQHGCVFIHSLVGGVFAAFPVPFLAALAAAPLPVAHPSLLRAQPWPDLKTFGLGRSCQKY